VDEIRRFNKAQQDAFLLHGERDTIILLGATTENPSFEVIGPLLSHSLVVVGLQPLSDQAIGHLLDRALADEARELGRQPVDQAPEARRRLIGFGNGDARAALTALDFVVTQTPPGTDGRIWLDERAFDAVSLKKALRYDKGGEDSRFIACRMIIFVSEDIGNADPLALLVATAVAQAVEFVGLPEAQISLAQGTTNLATRPKDNASYVGLLEAIQDAREHGNLAVPLHLRNAVTSLMRDLGYGKGHRTSTRTRRLSRSRSTSHCRSRASATTGRRNRDKGQLDGSCSAGGCSANTRRPSCAGWLRVEVGRLPDPLDTRNPIEPLVETRYPLDASFLGDERQ
jgi:putative ATPase